MSCKTANFLPFLIPRKFSKFRKFDSPITLSPITYDPSPDQLIADSSQSPASENSASTYGDEKTAISGSHSPGHQYSTSTRPIRPLMMSLGCS